MANHDFGEDLDVRSIIEESHQAWGSWSDIYIILHIVGQTKAICIGMDVKQLDSEMNQVIDFLNEVPVDLMHLIMAPKEISKSVQDEIKRIWELKLAARYCGEMKRILGDRYL